MAGPRFAGIWREDDRARAAYSEGAGIYRIVPRAVAIPSTTRALVDIVRWAGAEGVPLVPRGSGSGMPGGNVGDGVLVDLTVLDGAPLAVNATAFEATTGTATRLGSLDAEAGRFGLRMPVDPSSARFATVGGAVSTNAAGSRTVRYGPVRRWVTGLSLVTAGGRLVRLERGQPASDPTLAAIEEEIGTTLRLAKWRVATGYPRVRKNTAGYALDAYLESGDLLDLIIGAEGTLGFVTDVSWRLEPIPPYRAGVRAGLRDLKRLTHCLPALLELAPSRLEFLDASFLRFVEEAVRALPRGDRLVGGAVLLMLELEGPDPAAVDRDLERAVGILRSESIDVEVGRDGPEIDTLWAIRHAASPKLASLGNTMRSLQVIEDACVPVLRLGEYLLAVQAIAGQRGVPVVMFGHAGDGNVHANLLANVTEPGWEGRVKAIFDDVSQLVVAMGASPSGEHGDGRLRAGLVDRVYGAEVGQLLRVVKRAFDPNGIMNPGIKLGDGEPISRLKVGAQAAPIDPEIAAGLRRIERDAGYSTGRLQLADDPGTISVQTD
ncbi:MAG: FAD-binding oxidoreductase [Gemmatimonadales bacterium]